MSHYHSDPPAVRLPLLTRAGSALTREIEVLDEYGDRRVIHIPDERPLTLYVDRRELVTLMTLGAEPELLALGYLRNQRLVTRVDEVLSITADWDVDAVAVRTRAGIEDFERKTASRVVTTGCGQGTVFGDMMDSLQSAQLPDAKSAHQPVDAAQHPRGHAPAGQHPPRKAARCMAARCFAAPRS
jgi:FdhD protein